MERKKKCSDYCGAKELNTNTVARESQYLRKMLRKSRSQLKIVKY